MSTSPTLAPTSSIASTPGAKVRLAAFAAVHLATLAALWTGVSVGDLVLCAVLYGARMFGVTAGYHRYFSHRTYELGRVSQFLMAFLAMTSAQKGIIWWASHHRHHHRASDTEHDVHSPRQHGFWWSHIGWVLSDDWDDADPKRVRDLMRFPELVWLDRHPLVPPTLLAIAVWALFGWSGLVVGFLWSTVLLWHATFTINSLSHVFGTQPYDTNDDSRNNFWLALLTFGEGWHNNHHFYQASARQGFRWWQIDLSYYGLKVLSWLRIVRNLKRPPRHVVLRQPHPLAESC